MGLLDFFRSSKNEELEFFLDWELIEQHSKDTALKQLAVQTVIGMLARTIIQSEFRVKKNGEYIKDEMYYRFNVRPNVNQSASVFWERAINKLIYDGECLIIKTDTDDLLIADDYTKTEYAIYGDSFKNVIVKDYEFKRVFERSEVIYFEYGNEKLSKLIDSLFYDYGKLLRRLFDYQMRKNQIRSTVDVEAVAGKEEKTQKRLQNFINKAYKAISEKDVAIIPQQKGFTYKEHTDQKNVGQSIDELEKLTGGFLNQVARAVGVPISLLKGDLADVEGATRNYMKFAIDPILKVIESELNMQFIPKRDYLNGKKIDIRRARYRDIFDVATALDKLIASSAFKGNELRDELGYEMTDEEIHNTYFVTKNYQKSSEALEGSE